MMRVVCTQVIPVVEESSSEDDVVVGSVDEGAVKVPVTGRLSVGGDDADCNKPATAETCTVVLRHSVKLKKGRPRRQQQQQRAAVANDDTTADRSGYHQVEGMILSLGIELSVQSPFIQLSCTQSYCDIGDCAVTESFVQVVSPRSAIRYQVREGVCSKVGRHRATVRAGTSGQPSSPPHPVVRVSLRVIVMVYHGAVLFVTSVFVYCCSLSGR